jgi:predicted DNA-binding transcriptional regulator YafY
MTEQAQYAIGLQEDVVQLWILLWKLRERLAVYEGKGYAKTPEAFDVPEKKLTPEKVQNVVVTLGALDGLVKTDDHEAHLAAMV